MNDKASPLANAFLWAVVAAAAIGLGDLLAHETLGEAGREARTAAVVAGVVGFVERKYSRRPLSLD